jgi:hypothetical protein
MKRLICSLLVLAFVLCACEKDEHKKGDSSELNSFVEEVNAEERLSGDYQLEITFGDRKTLFFAKGDIAWDRSDLAIYSLFDRTYLGSSGKTENFYQNGKMISLENGKVVETEQPFEAYFEKFPYFKIPLLDENCSEIKLSESSVGTTYSFTRTDGKEISKMFLEDDIYELVGVLKKPQPELTEYGEVECVYTVKDGKIVSCRFEFDMKLFDTPAYIPGYIVPEEEYTLNVHITAKVGYESFGEGVIIKEYEETEETSKAEGSQAESSVAVSQ